MKIMEDFKAIDSLNLFLSNLRLGESTIKGRIEVFSCKNEGSDRKQSISLEREILDYLGQSYESDGSSPVDYLASRSSRKTLIFLTLTLCRLFPDYEFSAVNSNLFFKEEEWNTFKEKFETYLFEAAKEWAVSTGGSSLLQSISDAINEVMKLGECEIYSYNPDFDVDPLFDQGAIWSFIFLFYNRKLKRVLSFQCCCLSNVAPYSFSSDGESDRDDEDDELFHNMDM